MRYGTVGPGSYPHYDMAYFAKRAGDLDMIAIPNKAGATGVINDMLNGSTQVDRSSTSASSGPQVKAGSSAARSRVVNHARLPDFPDVATDAGARLRRASAPSPIGYGRLVLAPDSGDCSN